MMRLFQVNGRTTMTSAIRRQLALKATLALTTALALAPLTALAQTP